MVSWNSCGAGELNGLREVCVSTSISQESEEQQGGKVENENSESGFLSTVMHHGMN